jgi:acyl-coenzyme A thioesterase PaaI-like protein
VETLDYGRAIVRLPHSASYLRPGGTVSGPAMMTLADFSLYVAVLSAIGREELAVTSQLSINFLRKPRPADLLADTRMIRIGRRLAYGEVFLYSDGADGAREGPGEPVAHVTGSYALPAPPR